ncbi:uncharacterized protein LOC129905790 [Episyrphus balteatus]|uniref:uncharacterized protein LOC129905790 n=1 Tax=Episyrphus balteatus TaxID=286459 RepID=UPI002485844C|nr:uncharacterized protein LOC129905790 [Episyrphus balteatus]
MESNEISMFMDVKIDIHDKKSEALKFKSWMKCLVKIEAIKCLPCFLRITFIRNVEDEAANLSVSINIPGITISLASSRTKQYSYGIFWMQNRKRCFIYFAVDSESSCRRHMKWMKKSIKNLELHRQIFLETRRSSRGRLEGTSTSKMGKQNLQAILGPLPKIPDADSINWSRRVSGMSGIYEEIPDGVDTKLGQQSRGSIASGIYEEMKPAPIDCKAIREEALEPAPPLPPRKRINTFEQDVGGIPRSNTNPESEMAKKKKYKNVLENIFGRSKRSESVSEGQVSNAEDLIKCSPDKEQPPEQFYANTPNSHLRPKQNNTSLAARKKAMANKRNSFSSPDLSKFNVFDDLSNLDENISLSSELLPIENLNDSAIEIVIHKDEESLSPKRDSLESLNISEQIQPNFNFSCNSSTVNLVGSNLNIKSSQQQVLIDDNSGYCAMAPIVKEQSSDSDKENDDDQKDDDDDDKTNEGQESHNESAVYENMANSSALNKSSHLYENIGICLSSGGDKPSADLDESYYQTPRKSIISIDDKVPSYYPNSCDTAKTRRRSPSIAEKTTNSNNNLRHLANIKVIRRENLYISSPQKIIDQRMRSTAAVSGDSIDNHGTPSKKSSSSPLMARKISENVYTVTRHGIDEFGEHQLAHSQSQRILNLAALQNIDFKFDDTKNESDLKNNCMQGSESASRIYQKYATLARITPNNKYIDKCSKSSKTNTTNNDLSNVKKFTSLPRFKKIDFSPLKLKINNVLQRHHNSEI